MAAADAVTGWIVDCVSGGVWLVTGILTILFFNQSHSGIAGGVDYVGDSGDFVVDWALVKPRAIVADGVSGDWLDPCGACEFPVGRAVVALALGTFSQNHARFRSTFIPSLSERRS